MTDELKAEREAFEKWWAENFSYVNEKLASLKQYAWFAWQARAKLDRTHSAPPEGVEMSDQAPDFDALRAERNAKHGAFVEAMRAKGWELSREYNYNRDACYCACGSGGPCEHSWTGEPYVSEDGSMWSATCARCGMLAYSHSLRTAP